jgi:ribosomal protein S18 acetylase RimI-like enzyme
MHNLKLHVVKEEHDIKLFWQWRDRYVHEDILPNSTFKPSTDEDYEWFFSQEYKDIIMEAFYRELNPIRIIFLKKDRENIGFAIYVIYHTEDGKCLIVDFCINAEYRNQGAGTLFLNMLQEHVTKNNAAYFALNVTNEENKRFWQRNGFCKTTKDEHGNDIYEKRPSQ